ILSILSIFLQFRLSKKNCGIEAAKWQFLPDVPMLLRYEQFVAVQRYSCCLLSSFKAIIRNITNILKG
ncbi:MAG TPA: hypothetical protein PLV12_06310, partial [Saprospiraceae bacterium]|nr:hypothetical protein [Saprospiraceae bacterium]